MSKTNTTTLAVISLSVLGLFFLLNDKDKSKDTKPSKYPPIPPPPSPSSSPTAFVKKYYPYAIDSEHATGVPALLTIAQAGIESAWGKFAFGNNFFGIKKGKGWNGAIQSLKTWECSPTNDTLIKVYPAHSQGSNDSCNTMNKPSYRVSSEFRAYPTAKEGFIDHGNFLKTNKRYNKAFAYTKDPIQFAREIARAGYATAPNYESVLTSTIDTINKLMSHGGGTW